MKFNTDQFDFNRCEEEPIHRPESIQGFGYLIAIDPKSRKIKIHSDNISSLYELGSESRLIGVDFKERLDATLVSWDFLHESYSKAKDKNLRLPVELRFHKQFLRKKEQTDFHAIVFASGDLMVVEIEPASLFSELVSARQYGKIYASSIAPTFGRLRSVDEVTQAIANSIRELTGYERVLIYRFNEDDTGSVISESKVDDIESYLGLHYPASDIPKQARELYTKNWIRINPDVEVNPVGLTPSLQESDRQPLDLTHSVIRAMSPIHIQYTKNQGIRSVMSISLMDRDRLWGLVSCHHRKPHYLPQNIRLECESLGHLFGWQIYAKQEEVYLRTRMETDAIINSLIEGLSDGESIVEIFRKKEHEVLELMDASGFVFFAGEDTVTIGQAPAPEILKKLALWASGQKGDESYRTSCLESVLDKGEVSEGTCGALVIPLLSEDNYFTIWFRPESARTIKWAGNPKEKSLDAPKSERLTPRTSFTLHEEKVKGHSKPWSNSDMEIARRFNRLFLRHVLRQKIDLQENIDRLEVRDQMKNEFLATLAHELRNPLSPISNALTILESSSDDEDREIASQIAKRQLKNLTTLVDDLLDVSRITRGKISLKSEPVNLKEVVQGAIETNQALLDDQGHTLERDLPDVSVIVKGDFTRLSQCVGNILNNAAKYTPSGGKIQISLQLVQNRAELKIKDNGIGIPDTYLRRVFDIFTQVDAASTRTLGGLGIGLTLTKRLIELHDGWIDVESEGANMGSCFTISLPVKKESTNAETSRDENGSNASERPQRLMLVEDKPDVARMLAIVLRRKGFEVTTFNNAEDALDDFEKLAPKIALIDIGLPGMNGYELCRKIRNTTAGRDAILIAQTGWSQPELQKEAVDAGFDYHLVKPVELDALDKALEGAARKRFSN